MKKVIVKNNVKLIGIKNFKGEGKNVDYYILCPGKERIYAFSREYRQNAYDLCKSGICIIDLSTRKSRDRGIMNLVSYLNIMLPYLCDYYDVPLAI